MRIISGKYKGRRLTSPKGISIRPSTDRLRETLMNILEGGKLGYPLKSKVIIDVFAGTGSLGLETASRGNPQKVIFIDNDINAVSIIKDNIQLTDKRNVFEIIQLDVLNINKWEYGQAELIFMDPPYFSNLFSKSIIKLANLNALLPGALVVLETSAKESFNKIDNFENLFSKKVGKSQLSFFKFSPSFK